MKITLKYIRTFLKTYVIPLIYNISFISALYPQMNSVICLRLLMLKKIIFKQWGEFWKNQNPKAISTKFISFLLKIIFLNNEGLYKEFFIFNNILWAILYQKIYLEKFEMLCYETSFVS